jgi:hypothetical protein
MRNAADALVAKADTIEDALDKLIQQHGYDAAELMREAYKLGTRKAAEL